MQQWTLISETDADGFVSRTEAMQIRPRGGCLVRTSSIQFEESGEAQARKRSARTLSEAVVFVDNARIETANNQTRLIVP